MELLGEDPDDHTETAANDLFTATARVVEGLATDDGDRADALVAAGALRPLKRAVVDSVRYVYSDRIHTASNRRSETFLRAAIAANALGNVAEHSPPPPPPPRRKGKGRGGRRLPSRAMRVAADDEQERDGDKSFVEALGLRFKVGAAALRAAALPRGAGRAEDVGDVVPRVALRARRAAPGRLRRGRDSAARGAPRRRRERL